MAYLVTKNLRREAPALALIFLSPSAPFFHNAPADTYIARSATRCLASAVSSFPIPFFFPLFTPLVPFPPLSLSLAPFHLVPTDQNYSDPGYGYENLNSAAYV